MNRVAGLAVSAALLLSACGQGGGEKITRMIDSCATLKAIDAPSVIGVDFDPPQSLRDMDAGENMGKLSSCGLTSSVSKQESTDLEELKAQMSNIWFVTLMAWTWPDVRSAEAYMDSMRQSGVDQKAPVAVSSVGDEAVWNGILHARKGNVTISMDVRHQAGSQDGRSEKNLETELAQRALDNLK